MRQPQTGIFGTLARLLAFGADDRGTIAITSAMFFVIAISASALVVDVGALYLDKRKAQGVADLAAMAAAGDPDRAQAAAVATLRSNGITATTAMTVETGRYEPDAGRAVGDRFTPGLAPVNAARVRFTKTGPSYFAKTFNSTCCGIRVGALAYKPQLATFSIGSRLASVREGVVNGVLGSLLGGNVNLSLMDYNALAAADISLLDFSNALATRLSLTGGTYDQLFSGSANVGDIIAALASVTDRNGNTTASSALRLLGSQSNASAKTVSLSSLLDFGALNDKVVGTAAPGSFKAMQILSGAATISNGKKNIVNLDLGATVPGLLSVKADIAIGEPPQNSPWAAVGERGATIRTAQTRVRITAEVGGTGLLAGLRLRVPLYVDAAYAKGRLSKVACASDGTGSATVGVTPGIAVAAIGDVANGAFTDFNVDATINKATIVQTSLNLLLLSVDLKVLGRAVANAGNMSETPVTFTAAEISAGTKHTVSTNSLAQSLLTSLLGQLALEVQLTPLAITTPSAVTALVGGILASAAAPLDAVVFNILNTLGVHVGEADVWVQGVQCRGAALAG